MKYYLSSSLDSKEQVSFLGRLKVDFSVSGSDSLSEKSRDRDLRRLIDRGLEWWPRARNGRGLSAASPPRKDLAGVLSVESDLAGLGL